MSRTGTRGKHGKHTEHYKFSITKMAELFSKQPFLNHARLPRVLIVPVKKCKEVYFLGFFITFITTAISIITITVINCPLLHFY